MKSIVFITLSLVSFTMARPQNFPLYHFPYDPNTFYQQQEQQQQLQQPPTEATVQEFPMDGVSNSPSTEPITTNPETNTEITDPTIAGMEIKF